MRLNDYLEMKKVLLQELKETLPEERRKAIFEELVSINRTILEQRKIEDKIAISI